MTTTQGPDDIGAGPGATATAVTARARVGSYRWVICALLFLATTVNYVDRQVIGILKPTLQAQLGWSEIDYGNIVFAFTVAYALGLLFVGRLIDRLGTKLGYSLALIVWSAAAVAHAGVRSVVGFASARFALGLGESANFPAAIKCTAEWFPKKERALATGLFNSGANVGALVAPLAVPWLTLTWGWQAAFIATGALGLLWLVFWIPLYAHPARHRHVSPAELAYIQSDPADATASMPWRQVLAYREAWAFAIAKFLTDPVWWLYLFWAADFLNRNYGVSLGRVGLPLVVIYQGATVGSIGGGWLSSWLIRRGWSLNGARKTAMLTFALMVVPIVFATQVHSMWAAVALITLAAGAHQGWSANLFTTASDAFPRHAVASVVSFGGMAGAVGGMGFAKLTGYLLQVTGSYFVVLLIAGVAYLTALAIFHLLVPRLAPLSIGD